MLDLSQVGTIINQAFGLGLFGNEILLGLFIIISTLILMMFLRMGTEGVLAIMLALIMILSPEGIIDKSIMGLAVIITGFLWGSGIWRTFQRD